MTKNGSNNHWLTTNAFWIIGACVAAAVYFFGLTIPLVGPDEPRYAQVAREMFERGDWVTPTLGGFDWFEKPALLYWLQIAAYSIFGVTEFAARFGSALFGLGTAASLWFVGRSIDKEAGETAPIGFANLFALLAVSSIGIIVFARGASFDIILTFPMTAAVACFFLWERGRQGFLPLAGFYFFVGVSILAKGLVGIVFPFGIVAFYFLLSWRWPGKTFLFSLLWGTAVSIAVASAWYVPMYFANGWKFIDEFFIQHHFQRYTSNKYFHPQPFYFFFWVLPLMTIPWLPFFAAGIWRSAKDLFFGGSERDDRFDSVLRFAAAWLLVPLVFFSFSGSKLPGYILPALPPALIIAGVAVSRFIGSDLRRSRLVLGLGGMTMAVVVILLVTVVPRFADDDSVKRLIEEATDRGFKDAEILGLHTVSHNAEFYAPGRLLRAADGKQAKLYGINEVVNEIRRQGGRPLLVLVPNEWMHQLTESPVLASEFIAKNAETSILAVSEKSP